MFLGLGRNKFPSHGSVRTSIFLEQVSVLFFPLGTIYMTSSQLNADSSMTQQLLYEIVPAHLKSIEFAP